MVAYPADRYTDEERKEGCERLLVAFVEGVIGGGEQACDGETELDEAAACTGNWQPVSSVSTVSEMLYVDRTHFESHTRYSRRGKLGRW